MKLPVLSVREVIKILENKGFKKESQRGSHIKLKKREGGKVWVVIVPNYPEIHHRVLLSVIKQSGLEREDFC